MKDYYAILGIDRFATEKEIKDAYHRLAKEYHPDKWGQNGLANERFEEINEAYHTLINREKRRNYDRMLNDATGRSNPEFVIKVTQAEMAYHRGMQSLSTGEYHKAVEFFRAAVNFNPHKAEYKAKFGLALAHLKKDITEAEKHIKEAQEKEIFNPEHYVDLGRVYRLFKMEDKASEQFREALRWNPKHKRAMEELRSLEKKEGLLKRLFGG
ncbi:MAG: DnaJ domain-containing protein [Candidatus Edwardsbacteria bacterium]